MRRRDGDAMRSREKPNMFAVLPVTETEHMIVGAFVDDEVKVMTPYQCVVLEDREAEPSPEIHPWEPQVTLLVTREVNGHVERVGIVIVGPLNLDGVHVSSYGTSSTGLANDVIQLSELKGPKVAMQQLWRQKAEERTICLS